MKRRDFIKNSALSSSILVATGISMLNSRVSAAWDALTYESNTAELAIQRKFNKGTVLAKSKNIKFKVPHMATNSLIVPITIDARKRNNVKSIAIVVDENPHPLAAFARFGENTQAFLSIRIKMAKSSKVRAVLDTNLGLEEVSREVKIVIGS